MKEQEYEYKVHEPKIVAIVACLLLFAALLCAAIGVDQFVSGTMTEPIPFFILLISFLLPGILLLLDYKRRALYVIRSGYDYCYVPFIGNKRCFRREDIATAKIRRVKFSPADLCIVATDHDGKKLFGVELNMINAERIAAIAQSME